QTYVGNAELDQAKYHSLRAGFRNYNFQMRSGWMVFANANFYDSQITSSTIFDENRKRTTTYENMSGVYSLSLFGNWNKSYKFNDQSSRDGRGTRVSGYAAKGYAHGVLYMANAVDARPKAHMAGEYSDLLTKRPR